LTALYSLRDARMRYNGAEVLRVDALDFFPAQMVSLVGPNGAGKSTLLGIMAGLRAGYAGHCLFSGREVSRWPRRRFARSVSFVPQTVRLDFPFTAEQVVFMGRTPYCDGLFESPEDRHAVQRAMELTDTLAFRTRDFRSLSGGERQRVILASALAQQPEVLLLDEPATFLDLKHQLAIHRLLRDLSRQGLLIVAATHDLSLAAAYSHRVVVLHRGAVVADAPPAEALQPETVRAVFEVEARLQQGSKGALWVLYDD